MDDFESSIISFCGNRCTCSCVDIGRVNQIQYPPNFRMPRLMCSGALTPCITWKSLNQRALARL